ncbi:MAG: RNA methyltransferase [Candidatus Bathyarchaeia archaeon]|nr:RNA methyltransferase [Candidatus Bathyarchaeota archaeon]
MAEFRVVLVEPEYEANIGYIARVMKNFGLNELYLVKPRVNLGSKALIFSAHAQDIVNKAVIVNSIQEAIKGVDIVVGTTAKPAKSERNILRLVVKPEEAAMKINTLNSKVALLFGRESSGLTNEELSLCDLVLFIPASEEYPTLNVSHAAAIVFYEFYKNKYSKESKLKLEKNHLVRLINVFNEVLLKLNMPTYKVKLAQMAFHKMLLKGITTSREATLLLGVFRKIKEKLM